MSDLVWFVTFAGGALTIADPSAASLVGWWCVSGTLAMAVAAVQLRLVPSWRPTQGGADLRDGAQLAGEFLVGAAIPQVMVALAGATGDVGRSASFRLAATLLAPAGIIAAGLAVGLQPGAIRRSENESSISRAVTATWSLAGAGVVACTVVAVALPNRIGEAAFGEAFRSSRPYVVVLGCAGIALSGCAALGLAIRARGLLGRALGVRAVVGTAIIAVAVVAAASGSALAIAVVYAVGSWVLLVGLWRLVRMRQGSRDASQMR